MFILRIALVIVGLFILTAEGADLGQCKNCGCAKATCNYPKTAAECKACAKAIGLSSTSMDRGFCWILFGRISEGDCALRTYSNLVGCSGFSGYTYYGGVKKNCWAMWEPTGGRKRRDVSNLWSV